MQGKSPSRLEERGGVPVLRRVRPRELDLTVENRVLPFLVFQVASVKLRHHFAREQLEARADVFVGVLASLIEQDDLVHVRLLELAETAPQCLG